MARFEDLLDQIEDDDLRDELRTAAEEASPLRRQLKEAHQEINRLKPYEGEVVNLKKAPKREQAFRDAGVDFDNLRPAEKALLEQFDWDGDETPTAETVSEFVTRYDLPTTGTQTNNERPAAADIVDHARGASAGNIPQADRDAAIEAAKTPEELQKVLEQHPFQPQPT